MKRLNLTDTYGRYKDITIYEILKRLSDRFPNGFKSVEATTFLKREFHSKFFSFYHLHKNLKDSYCIKEDYDHGLKENKSLRNRYQICLENIPSDTQTDIESIITPKLEEVSLKN